MEKEKIVYTKPSVYHAKEIHNLINMFASQDKMLPRSLVEIYENIRDFFIALDEKKVVGCCALHIFWENLAEIRSLAVRPEYQSKHIGYNLVKLCIEEARVMKISQVFALTYVSSFFEKMGFKQISRDNLPQKVWADCIKCPKFPNCDETAVIYTVK